MTDRRQHRAEADRRALLVKEKLRRAELLMKDRDPQGVAPVEVKPSATWIITMVDPVLMAQPLTGGPAVSVESSASLKGAKPGMRIEVQVNGYGRRVAVALIDPLPISERDKAEPVATVTTPKGGTKEVTVGGDITIGAGDVGAMPDSVKATDIGGASATHSHSGSVTIPSTGCSITTPNAALPWYTPNLNNSQATINGDFALLLERLKDAVGQLSNKTVSCSGCGAAGTRAVTVGAGSGGGGYTPPVGSRSVTVNVAPPIWFDPGSPATFSTQWAADINELTWRLYEKTAALKGRTLQVSSGGSITLNYSLSVNVTEVGGAGGFSSWWSETTADNLGVLFSFWQWLANQTFSVSGGSGGTVTIGGIEPSWNNPGIPSTFSQPYAAAVRLMLKRLFDTAQSICGRSF